MSRLRMRIWQRVMVALVAGIAVVGLCGWAFDVSALTRMTPEGTTMKVNTAISLLTLALLALTGGSPRPRRLRILLASAVAVLATAAMAEWIFGIDLGIDQILVGDPAATSAPGRTAPNTAVALIALSTALVLLDTQVRKTGLVLCGIAGAIGWAGIVGDATATATLSGIGSSTRIALPTSIGLVLLALAILARELQVGPDSILLADSPGGALLRRLLPVAFLVPTVLGALTVRGWRGGFYGADIAIWLLIVCSIGTLAMLSLRSAHGADQREADRRAGEAADIEDRRRREEQIRQLNAELEHRVELRTAELHRANQELEAFAYAVAHDLRAPLRAIQGFSTALSEDYRERVDEKGQDYIRRVCAATSRMGILIDDLLELSRIGRAELHVADVDLGEQARQIIAGFREREPERHVEFAAPDSLVARGDPRLLRIALENLVENAWKYTSPREVAHIELGERGGRANSTFYVHDDGVGFDMAYVTKLFNPFQRLHGQEFPGTGIGLATVQRIVSLHGGRVWAEGAPDGGATFSFTLGETA